MIKRQYFYNVRIGHPSGGHSFMYGVFFTKSWLPLDRSTLMAETEEIAELNIRPKFEVYKNLDIEVVAFNRI